MKKEKVYEAPHDHEAISTGFGNYRDQKPAPQTLHGATFDLQRESYGPQFHDRTPEFTEYSGPKP